VKSATNVELAVELNDHEKLALSKLVVWAAPAPSQRNSADRTRKSSRRATDLRNGTPLTPMVEISKSPKRLLLVTAPYSLIHWTCVALRW